MGIITTTTDAEGYTGALSPFNFNKPYNPYRFCKDGTRIKMGSGEDNDKVLLNIKYNINADNVISENEFYSAIENHYNLSLTKGTKLILDELGYFQEIKIPEYSVDDENGKKEMNKIQKVIEDKMHAAYTKIAEMGLIKHNSNKNNN